MQTTLPTICESYAFWSKWFRDRPDEKFSFQQNTREQLFTRGGGSCPFCNSTELVSFPSRQTTGVYESETVFCACMVFRAMNRKWECESSFIPAKINELVALDNPKNAATNTKTIKYHFKEFVKGLGRWIYLYGGYGSGKTHLLRALKTNLRGLALYVNVSDLSAKIYESLGNHTLGDLENELASAPILLMDDFGAEHGTDYLYATLYRIINNRYDRSILAPTVFTSNFTYNELAVSTNNNLKRIASRLSDGGLVTHLTSIQIDYRGIK